MWGANVPRTVHEALAASQSAGRSPFSDVG